MTVVIPAVLRLSAGSVLLASGDIVGARRWDDCDGMYLDVYTSQRTIEIAYVNEQERNHDLNNIEMVLANRDRKA
jgi:hypothetical protein